ncbi:FAD/NAD(P)-binding protein [Sphingobium bisphenolivorans]|uniref:FAD/NAD(P)-binding protein n=1 Tax=Sphingobium bisphenolivorans TaxID=1335760 RepID=UPI000399C5D3
MLKVDQAVIIGGGFSGTLLGINLLRYGTLKVTIIERQADRLGRGLAYGAAQEGHILNVRAANMSALPDQPDHFADWLATRRLGEQGSFATRRDYGAYLCALLDEVSSRAQGRLTTLAEEAIDLLQTDGGVRAILRSGATVDADIAALAPGNLPPHDLPAFARLQSTAYVNDPSAPTSPRGCSPRTMSCCSAAG